MHKCPHIDSLLGRRVQIVQIRTCLQPEKRGVVVFLLIVKGPRFALNVPERALLEMSARGLFVAPQRERPRRCIYANKNR